MPEPARGAPVLMMLIAYTGPVERAEQVLEPLLTAAGPPLIQMLETTDFLTLNSTLDAVAPWGWRALTSGGYVAELTPEIVQAAYDSANASPPPVTPGASTTVSFWSMGGAIDEVEEDTMAFSRSGASWFWDTVATWALPEQDDLDVAWVQSVRDAMRPHSLANAYVNLTSERGRGFVRRAYGEQKFKRLSELKRVWDPANLLRFNKNIEPAERASLVLGRA